MRDLAPKTALDEQTLILEDAQSKIKLLIGNSVFRRELFSITKKKVAAVIKKAVDSLSSDELKNISQRMLEDFATVQYRKLKDSIGKINISIFTVLLSIRNAESERVKEQIISASGYTKDEISDEVSRRSNAGYYEIRQPIDVFSKDYIKKVEEAFNRLMVSNAKDGYGSNVSLRNISEMQIREEWQQEQFERLRESGEKFVYIVGHANCSERCEPWQDRLYSLDGTAGTYDGLPFVPIENARDIYYTTKAGKTYKNGCTSGFGCRHKLQKYTKGTKPQKISAEVIEKQRDIEKKQRYYERGVRDYKDMRDFWQGKDKTLYRKYRAKEREWRERYIALSKANNVAYYPSRLRTFEGGTEE